jgi:hypothetical protein
MKLNIPSLALLAMMTGQVAADLTCVGDCAPTSVNGSEDCFILTPAENNKVGAVWAGQAADITTDFTVTASLYFGSKDDGADGIAFVIQNVLGSAAVGKDGGRLGFLDISDFFAVDVDTYWNHNLDEEMLADHVYVSSKNGAFGESAVVNSGANIEDGAWYDFEVSWVKSSGVMSVSFGTDVVITRAVPSISDVLGGATTAYFGFTAATGGFNNLQQICDVVVPGDVTGVVTATTVAPTTPVAAVVSVTPAVCDDFAVFGTTALTFGATNFVHNGNVGSVTTITEAEVTLDTGFEVRPTAAFDGTTECADAIQAAVDAFKIAGPTAEYETLPWITIPTDHVFTAGKYFAGTLDTAAAVNVIFDAQGDPDATFTIQAGTTLGFGADTTFELRNGAKAQNILWEAGTTVGIGAGTAGQDSHFVGSIIAGTTVTAGATMQFYGRLFANTANTMAATNTVDPLHVVPFTTVAARYLRH